jgi:Ca-activated chloride channel family protein
MAKPTRFRYLVLALLSLVTLGAHFVHQAHAETRRLRNGSADGSSGFWSLGRSTPRSGEITRHSGDSNPIGITLHTQVDRDAVMQGGDGRLHVEVTLAAPDQPGSGARQGTDMVVIVDRSGSMSGEKLFFAKEAMRHLVRRLGDNDRLGVVAYDSYANILIPLSYATADARSRWLRKIDALRVRGNTNMSGGLDLGLGMLERSRRTNHPARVLLLSDGLANEGDSSLAGLTRRARRAVHGEYVLSTMGIGDDFDERLMTRLAGAGTGAFYYLAKLAVLPSFFDAELKTATQTIAFGATLELRLAPGVRVNSVMGLPFEQRGSQVVVPLGSLYASHTRQVWVTLQVPTQRLTHFPVGKVGARFNAGGTSYELEPRHLPQLSVVRDYARYRSGIRGDVWERAMLDEALSRSQEEMGDAISKGTAADVDRAMAKARRHARLAKDLGRKAVVAQIDTLEREAKAAKQAQAAPAPVRRAAAKRQKTNGYIRRNSSSYVNSNPAAGY